MDNIEWRILELGELMKKKKEREKWRLIMRKSSICPYGHEAMRS